MKQPEKPEQETLLKLYTLYLSSAEKVSDRRASANTWSLAVNSALIGFYGYLEEGSASVDALQKGVWLWAIPAAGIIVCLAWAALLSSYSKLNGAKFSVLQEMEKQLPATPFSREQDIYQSMGRRGLGRIEKRVPFTFIVLYGILFCAAMFDFLTYMAS